VIVMKNEADWPVKRDPLNRLRCPLCQSVETPGGNDRYDDPKPVFEFHNGFILASLGSLNNGLRDRDKRREVAVLGRLIAAHALMHKGDLRVIPKWNDGHVGENHLLDFLIVLFALGLIFDANALIEQTVELGVEILSSIASGWFLGAVK